MLNIRTIQAASFTKRRLLVFVSLLALLVVPGSLTLDNAQAAPNVNDTIKYCKSKIPKNLRDKACSKANMNRLHDAVKDQCKGKNRDACIENRAKDLIDGIAKKKLKNDKDFNNALDDAVRDGQAGGHANPGGNNCVGSTCSPTPTGQGSNCDNNNCDLIALYVNPGIRLLSLVVGIVVAASLVYAGIQYSASSGDPQKTGAAKTRIINTLLAFMAYAFMLAFLNFLVPGGIF